MYLFTFSTGSSDYSLTTKVVISFLTSLAFLVSFIGNSLVIHIVRTNQLIKSNTYLLILNMACGDLVTTIMTCISLIKRMFFASDWPSGSFGIVLCKISLYVTLVSFLGCILSLVGITIDRFMAVSRPLKHKPWSKWSKLTIPVIWVTSLLLPLNSVLEEKGAVYSENTNCTDETISLSTAIILANCFLLPFTVMVTLYPIISYRLWRR